MTDLRGAQRGDLDACAALLERGDPDRFRSVLAAPLKARPVLLPIYAFNLEVARAPWVTAEPMIAEMRLQWWRDVLAEIACGGPVRRHEVATPLAAVLDPEAARILDALVAARRWDCAAEPHADEAALWAYLDATAGGLMWVSARALGAGLAAPVRAAGQAAGLAAYLLAVPDLEARGRRPLPPDTNIAALARGGLDRLASARRERRAIPKPARAALLAGWRAPALLRRALADPNRVRAGTLTEPEVTRRFALIRASATGMI